MTSRYLIADEPRPSILGQHVVNPLWPILSQMLAGAWLAMPWFIFNSIALGSPNRRKDILLCCASVASSIIFLFLIEYWIRTEIISGVWIPLSFLSITVVRFYFAYLLYFSQSTVFELWQYYGGVEKNGMILLLLASFLVRPYLSSMISSDLLRIILF